MIASKIDIPQQCSVYLEKTTDFPNHFFSDSYFIGFKLHDDRIKDRYPAAMLSLSRKNNGLPESFQRDRQNCIGYNTLVVLL
jgi:hypothetical protein